MILPKFLEWFHEISLKFYHSLYFESFIAFATALASVACHFADFDFDVVYAFISCGMFFAAVVLAIEAKGNQLRSEINELQDSSYYLAAQLEVLTELIAPTDNGMRH